MRRTLLVFLLLGGVCRYVAAGQPTSLEIDGARTEPSLTNEAPSVAETDTPTWSRRATTPSPTWTLSWKRYRRRSPVKSSSSLAKQRSI